MVSEHYVACRIMTLGLETTKENFQLLLHLSILLVNFSNLLILISIVDELHQRSREERTTHDHDLGV